MHIQSVLVLLLVVCCVGIGSAQRPNCTSIYRSCVACSRNVGNTIDLNSLCRSKTKDRWIWRDQSQCDVLRISCENPNQKLNCDNIAKLAKMTPRSG
ncbi:uncharacterized protein [Drosophila virilis]|uniref:Uncharacterized protein n=1 Tax=Drosophila virilis TaxID=7244 RepID=B4LII1_DROVI|nr:uncharacterized protein LOC6622426 [Drosophila virilis]EDW70768.1 uncharacterized protein Dvir_GJ11358 [Drosophila virilis]